MHRVPYELVQLPNGTSAVRASAYAEKMHPGPGPYFEAEHLHLAQLKIQERLPHESGEFVVWDVGLGAAANALALLRLTCADCRPLRLISFDDTLDPLAFALQHGEQLGYFGGYESAVASVLEHRQVDLSDGGHLVNWQVHVADFPTWISQSNRTGVPRPHAIMFDPFSPARNPVMWTRMLFGNLFQALDPARACLLTTYSRSTLVRVALLVAGFFVGRGSPSGAKEETTVAANQLALLDEPLERDWLERARKSGSAEPLTDKNYRQAPLTASTWEKLCAHPQFAGS